MRNVCVASAHKERLFLFFDDKETNAVEVGDVMSNNHLSPGDLAARTPKRDPGSANCPLNFDIVFSCCLTNAYIYI